MVSDQCRMRLPQNLGQIHDEENNLDVLVFCAGIERSMAFTDTLWPAQSNYFALRTVWIQYSGVLAIGAMSVAMVLATRPAWLEPSLNGLDKMYRLHKWLGIATLAAATVHWLWAQGTKWAVGWGWLTRPARKPRAAVTDSMGSIESALRGCTDWPRTWANGPSTPSRCYWCWLWLKRFPYRLFAKTHHWMAAIYLVLAFHTLVLVQFLYWAQPVGWALAMLLASGTVSAVWVLLGRVGAQRTAHGDHRIAADPALNVLETTLRMDPGWPGHRPGQFAFAMSTRKKARTPTRWPQPGCRKTGALPSSPRRWATTPAGCLSAYG